MGRRCGLTGSTVGTAGQRKQDAAETAEDGFAVRDDMEGFMGTAPEDQCMVVVDPSAASFIAELRSRGVYVKPANNEVEDGIRVVGSLLAKRNIRINKENCKGLLGEMRSYVWDDKGGRAGRGKAVKQKDHGPDALRYYCYTVLPKWRIGA